MKSAWRPLPRKRRQVTRLTRTMRTTYRLSAMSARELTRKHCGRRRKLRRRKRARRRKRTASDASSNARRRKRNGPDVGSARSNAGKSSASWMSNERRSARNARNDTNAAVGKSARDSAIGGIAVEPETGTQTATETEIVFASVIAPPATAPNEAILPAIARLGKRNRRHPKNPHRPLYRLQPLLTRSLWKRLRYKCC